MVPGQPAVQVGDLLASKYRVERVLGQGGMGVVVAARHEQLGFRVAIKFMLPEALQDAGLKERFLREARAAGNLQSEHVARVTDFGTLDDGAPYIVMEFLHGSDLQAVVERTGALPLHEAVEYVRQACKAMAEAHAQGIVHRDLKPQNLFLTRRPDGTPLVKVLDFGISKLVGDERSLAVTSSAQMMGSPLYMAPEQMRSAKKVDARADIYSLGAILYQLLTGQVPVPAETLGELFERIFTQSIEPPSRLRPGLPAEVDAIVLRCLARNPDERFESVTQLDAAIAVFADPTRSMPALAVAPVAVSAVSASGAAPLGPATTTGAAISEPQPAIRRSRTAPLVWGVAAVAVLATGGFALARRGSSESPPAAAAVALPQGVGAPASASIAPLPSVNLDPSTPSAVASSPPPSTSTSSAPASASAATAVVAPPATSTARGRPRGAPGTSPPAGSSTPRPATPSKPAGADPFASPD